MLDQLAGADAADVLHAIVAKAKDGDPRCAELVLSRIWPQRKGRAVSFDVPVLETTTDLAMALGAIATAVGAGELTPAEGHSVAAVLEMQRRAIELVYLEARLAKLETENHISRT